MNFQNEHERERRRRGDEDGEPGGDSRPRARGKKRQPAEVGDALRTVYQATINEDIPPEMLDLLGKLS